MKYMREEKKEKVLEKMDEVVLGQIGETGIMVYESKKQDELNEQEKNEIFDN